MSIKSIQQLDKFLSYACQVLSYDQVRQPSTPSSKV